jgi:hypothetical protein
MDKTGYQYYENGPTEEIDADIYYNNAGFDHAKRTFVSGDRGKNTINYDMAKSGRKYGIDADLGIYENGQTADDIYEWYINGDLQDENSNKFTLITTNMSSGGIYTVMLIVTTESGDMYSAEYQVTIIK